jgi:PilZ domain-containing protein
MEVSVLQSNRRSDENRIDVGRPLELLDAGGNEFAVGYTRNLSSTGIRARFDTTTQPGANVLVRLTLEDGVDPVERKALIVWTAPDLYGDGMEVGLRLLRKDEEENTPATADPGLTPPIVRLTTGQMVELEAGGIGVEAVISMIGEIDDDGTIQITLSIDNDSGERVSSPDGEMFDEEEWKPHPFKDAYQTISKYAGPVLRVAAAALMVVGGFMAIGAKFVWKKLPVGFTAKMERSWDRIALKRRFDFVFHTVVRFVVRSAERVTALRASTTARQAK